MSVTGWQGRINDASTEEAVALVCRRYLELWTPEQLAELPESCRPRAELDSDDVGPYALRLIRQLGVGDRATAPFLYTLTTFFTKAALRMVQMRENAGDVPPRRKEARPPRPGA